MSIDFHRALPPAPEFRWLAVLVFIDLLFFPRLLFAFGIPLSLVIVMVSIFRERFNWRAVICLLALGTAMFSSVLFGAISGSNSVPIESFKRALQLMTILFYAFYRIDFTVIAPALVKVLRAFYIWVFFAMLLSFFDPFLYQRLFTYIYPETLDQLENTIEVLRFAYFFSDPNSAGYFICFTLVAYLSLERRLSWAFLCWPLATATVMATQSRGAYIALLLIFCYLMYGSDASRTTRIRVIVFIGLLAGALAFFYSEDITQAYAVFAGRFEQEDDIGGGRADKYAYFLQNLNLLPFGPGYHLQRGGAEFLPHSDLIRLNLAYGILALPLMLYFVFPRRRSQVLLFAVFLVPFLINTVIDDYRLFPMYLLIFALLGRLDTPRVATRNQVSLHARQMSRELTL